MPRAKVVLATAFSVLLLAVVTPAWGDHLTDEVYIHTGVRSEDEARAYPCAPAADAGGWERSGPVVCLPRRADTWSVEYTIPDSRGCKYDATGWSGSCVFDIDMGDHLRIWGTSGIQMTTVTVDWDHAGADPTEEPDPPLEGDDGSERTDGEGTPPTDRDEPSPPPRPTPPEPPSAPSPTATGPAPTGTGASSSGPAPSSTAEAGAPATPGEGMTTPSPAAVVPAPAPSQTSDQVAMGPSADAGTAGGAGRGPLAALALALLATAAVATVRYVRR